MYNVEAHDPLALLLWAGGAIATALVVRSRVIAVTAVPILTAWIGFEFGLALDDLEDAFAAFPVVAVLYGGILYGLATAAQQRIRQHWFASSGFLEAGRGVGLPAAAGGVFVFTFAEAAGELAPRGRAARLPARVVRAPHRPRDRRSGRARSLRPPERAHEGGMLAAAVLAVLAVLLVGGDGDVYAILFNLLFAAIALGTIYAGYLNDEACSSTSASSSSPSTSSPATSTSSGRRFAVARDDRRRSARARIAWLLERQRKRLLERMAA